MTSRASSSPLPKSVRWPGISRVANRGIGSALIAAFAAQAASARRSGIHVVTGERARNVRFYEKNEFRPLATVHWNGADAVFMGRLLRSR
jgi:GNAT superfamily N-acetyltransferase